MIATCTLCGDPISIRDCMEVDPLRNRKTVTALAVAMCQHLGQRHAREEQTVVDRAEFPPTKPNNVLTLIEASSAMGTLLTAMSFLKCEDEAFIDQSQKMKDLVLKSIEQKQIFATVEAQPK